MGSSAIASAQQSTAIGDRATASGIASTAIGRQVTASGDLSMAMGRLASTNGQSGSFVWGDASTGSTVTAAVPNEFTVRAAGGVRLRSASNLSTGCDLAASGGIWNCTSSKSQKTDFADVAGDDLLSRLHDLPVQTWRYTGEAPTVRHMGPYAEDFRAAFKLGTDSLTIGHIDLGGVSLAAAKALEARTRKLEAALDASTSEVSALRRQLAEMAKRLEEITKNRP
jgi:hypothetical protein